ncbi:MAG TPA: HAD-IIB family hydrolase [Opitutales bacterium]|nr:HAD-IIB family hydrolase [Opitutales bacterium]
MTDASDSRYLLISDLDDTLLGDDAALKRFRDFYRNNCASRFVLAYASGRFYDSIRKDIERTELPSPDYVLGGVGSEMRRYPDGEPVAEWIEHISANWSAKKIREILKEYTRLEPQPKASQSDYKVSYFYPDAGREALERLRADLKAAGMRIKLIYSSKRDLDVLPEQVDKGQAGAFLAQWLGIAGSRILGAGNSANDATLFEHGIKGIAVANAHDELLQHAEATGAYASPEAYADGVRDGVIHWLKEMEATHG